MRARAGHDSGLAARVSSEERDAGRSSRPVVVVANPSADVYGSDLQMLETVSALVEGGCEVIVTTPGTGALVASLGVRGASVEFLDYPVLNKAQASLGGMIILGGRAVRTVVCLVAYLRRRRPDTVYVNTVTLPWWIVAARLARVRVLCHVHEAEHHEPFLIRVALYGPLLAAHQTIVNSEATLRTLTDTLPWLTRRARRVYNGVPGPERAMCPVPGQERPFRLVLVARLSARKGVDVALEAVGLLRQAGRDVRLTVCGTAAPGYEQFEEQLRQRAHAGDLRGAVSFAGYVNPIWPALADAHAVLATSLGESLGNAVIEAQLSGRPVIASDVSGHDETIEAEVTGILVPASDPEALAGAVVRLMDSPELAARLAQEALRVAQDRFSVARYRADIRSVVVSGLPTREST